MAEWFHTNLKKPRKPDILPESYLKKLNLHHTSVMSRITNLTIYQHGIRDLVRTALTCFKVRILLIKTALFCGNEKNVEITDKDRLFQTFDWLILLKCVIHPFYCKRYIEVIWNKNDIWNLSGCKKLRTKYISVIFSAKNDFLTTSRQLLFNLFYLFSDVTPKWRFNLYVSRNISLGIFISSYITDFLNANKLLAEIGFLQSISHTRNFSILSETI